MTTKLHLVFSITILFVCFYGNAQSDYWRAETKRKVFMGKSVQNLEAAKTKIFTLKQDDFEKHLLAIGSFKNSSRTVYFPNENGELVPFMVSESSVLSPPLAQKYPKIKSYMGNSLLNKGDRIRFSVSHNGIQSMVVYADSKHTTFIQKTSKEGDDYVVYSKDAKNNANTNFICNTKSEVEKDLGSTSLKLVDDQTLKKYRIAVSATGEYTAFHGGTVADGLAAINATLTRVNEVFETDLGVTLELVPNNDLIIFTDASTDPYTGNLNVQAQSTLSSIIGEANYDVGHVFNEDVNNGNAGSIGSVCVNGIKGGAFSSGSPPEGDVFDLDFVAHELGHQFGANHTWSFDFEGTLVQAEPGSGTTIMGYAGIAGENNVAPDGDDYFHYNSIFQITEYLETTSCAVETALTNNPPVINSQGNFSIPKSTAFVLTGDATDVDGDILTYAWEQIDDGLVTTTTFGPTNPGGANFRSQRPSSSPQRFFPQLSSVAQGNLTQTNPTINSAWETVSDIERDMNFALTVRDNANGGGQVVSDIVNVQVINASGPFTVTSQASNETYEAGTVQQITWNVANTDIAPVNARTIDILLSTDGGLNFPTVLAENVPNDGMHTILLPGITTTNARIMVRANNNIFFAVNASDFTIQAAEIVLNFTDLEFVVCKPDNLDIPFLYETAIGFNEEVAFTSTGAPTGLNVSFSPTTATAGDTPVNIAFSGTTAVPAGIYPITITATSATTTKEVIIDVHINENTFSDTVLLSPVNGAVDTGIRQTFLWEANPLYTAYDIEIATDNTFSTIVEAASVIFNSYVSSNLEEQTNYFWRVKPKNECGEGTFGTPFNFTTTTINCNTRVATGLPLEISSVGTPTVISRVSFLDDLPIADVNVILDIDHSFLQDLIISLTSPSGTTVTLTSNSCGNLDNINAVFDDDAAAFVCNGTPGINGSVGPLGSLASFNGESAFGEWTLTVMDTAPADGGSLNAFSLEICVEGEFEPDEDGDGVFDTLDLCPGTPAGSEVDTDGCPVFRFPTDNFRVAIQSESCNANNDGAIQIDAMDTSITYTVDISDNGVNENTNFTDSYTLDNLMAGTYTVCITGTDGTIDYEEFCFDAVVSEPQLLNVTSLISEDGTQLMLTLEGGDQYTVELNGTSAQTQDSEITVQLTNGLNTLKVSTDLPCQGTFEEQIFASDQPIVYPNPFVDIIQVFLGTQTDVVDVTVHTSDGRLIRNTRYAVNGNEMDLDFTGLPSGMYFITLNGVGVKGTYKVLKQ